MKNFAEKKQLLGRLARDLYRRLSAARQSSKPFPGSCRYWEDRYNAEGNSGVGSYGKFAAFKAEVINAFVATRGCSLSSNWSRRRKPVDAGEVPDVRRIRCE